MNAYTYMDRAKLYLNCILAVHGDKCRMYSMPQPHWLAGAFSGHMPGFVSSALRGSFRAPKKLDTIFCGILQLVGLVHTKKHSDKKLYVTAMPTQGF
jgi:hypothetical protein